MYKISVLHWCAVSQFYHSAGYIAPCVINHLKDYTYIHTEQLQKLKGMLAKYPTQQYIFPVSSGITVDFQTSTLV
jgi:hypothetical protein